MEPKIVPTERIPVDAIDPDALKVIRRLRNHGHEAYLVGGCVRDLLTGLRPKDFDVITSAKPRQVRRLFANSRVIGRRFRLVHVIFGDNVIEVSTFRADPARLAAAAGAEAAALVPGFGEELEETERPASESSDLESSDSDLGLSDMGEVGEPSDMGDIDADLGEPSDMGDIDTSDEGELGVSDVGELGAVDLGEVVSARGPQPWSDVGSLEPSGTVDADELEDSPRGGARPDDFDLNNLFGDAEQDARRRDFTVNALFYDPAEAKIIDYTGGLEDIDRRVLRTIRDADISFPEDPVRMIRAARFAAKLNFEIEASGRAAILKHRDLLTQCSQRRLLEEVFKILKGGHAARCLEMMDESGLLGVFLPEVAVWLAEDPGPAPAPEPAPVSEPAASEPEPASSQPELEPVPAPEPAEVLPIAEPAPEPEAAVATRLAAAGAPPSASAEAEAAAEPEVEAEEEMHGRCVAIGAGPDAYLYPEDDWVPDDRLVRAFLRVTWERPPAEGANDWVEDPHVHMTDDMFEAASFSRDAYLEQVGLIREGGEQAERARAAAVLRVLRWNGRLREIVASLPEDELAPRRRRRRRRGGRDRAAAAPAAVAQEATDSVLDGLSRRQLLLGYLRALDLLGNQGIQLQNSLQLSALFGPLVLTALDEQPAAKREQAAENLADDVLLPIARRHSLARRDRDGIKRTVLHLRRLISGELRRRGKGRLERLLVRDHFREAVVLMWMHCKASGKHWDDLRYWERRVKEARSRGR